MRDIILNFSILFLVHFFSFFLFLFFCFFVLMWFTRPIWDRSLSRGRMSLTHDWRISRDEIYSSIGRRIPGRRDACTDYVELAASSSESREWRRDARRDGTLDARIAQVRRSIPCLFSSSRFPFPRPTHHFFPLPQRFYPVYPIYSFASSDIIFNLLCTFDTCVNRAVGKMRWLGSEAGNMSVQQPRTAGFQVSGEKNKMWRNMSDNREKEREWVEWDRK